MEIYDYQNNGYLEIDEQYDSLSGEERRRLNEAFKSIRRQAQQEAEEEARKWFYSAVLPVLKHYAEESESVLTLEEKPDNSVVAVLKNNVGFGLAEMRKKLRIVMGLAVHTDIRWEEDGIRLELVFACEGMD